MPRRPRQSYRLNQARKPKMNSMAISSPKVQDKRIERSRDKVLRETYRILSEQGFSGASIDAIAKQSGVAKTTIYRHWPSRADLLLDACAKMGSKFEVPDTGSFRGDIDALVVGLASYLRTAPLTKILPSIVDAGEHDIKIAKLLQAQVRTCIMAPLYEVIERAQKKAEIGEDWDASHLIARIVG